MSNHSHATDELSWIRSEIRRLKNREALLRARAAEPGTSTGTRGGMFAERGPVRSALERAGFAVERDRGPVTLEAERDGTEAGTARYRVAS